MHVSLARANVNADPRTLTIALWASRCGLWLRQAVYDRCRFGNEFHPSAFAERRCSCASVFVLCFQRRISSWWLLSLQAIQLRGVRRADGYRVQPATDGVAPVAEGEEGAFLQ